jgi:crotonobetainyl-CoA:carnitine CoA-transferase CaiB-like acyl-CoA transferase
MPGALAGIRVIEFTQAWAGPFAGRILAALGAEVIKVEGPSRMDDWRGGLRATDYTVIYPDREPGARPWNRSANFNTQNPSKLGIALDLKQPEGATLARRLVALSHVLLHNSRPGVMERLGLGYAAVRPLRPDLVYVAMPAMGDTGPHAHFMAWGPNFEALCGQAAMLGYDDAIPQLTSYAFLDPTGGLQGAAATLTALVHWRRTGAGQYVEVSQQEATIPFVGESLLDYAVNGRVARPQGNRHGWAAPHDAYRCAGPDEWVAIDVRTDEEFAALCRVIGRLDLAADPDQARALDRHRHQDALRPAIEAWTSRHDKQTAATELLAVGVPAAPVQDARDLAADPHLRARGFFQLLSHPDVGTHLYPGLSLRLSRTPVDVARPAPGFGEHNEMVFRGLLGLSAAELEDLLRRGIIGDIPRDDRHHRYATSPPPSEPVASTPGSTPPAFPEAGASEGEGVAREGVSAGPSHP